VLMHGGTGLRNRYNDFLSREDDVGHEGMADHNDRPERYGDITSQVIVKTVVQLRRLVNGSCAWKGISGFGVQRFVQTLSRPKDSGAFRAQIMLLC
jgi:hypothetical protein